MAPGPPHHVPPQRVHRRIHVRALIDRKPEPDVRALRQAVDHELAHRKLGWLFRWPMARNAHRGREVEVTVSHAIYVLGLTEKARKAALHGDVGVWTQRKIRSPKLRSPLDRVRERKRRKVVRRWREKHRVKTPTSMFDSVNVDEIPPDAEAVLGYTGGSWPTYHELEHRFPNARVISAAISASEDADLLDVEQGDATPEQVPAWYSRQVERRKRDPGFYNLERNGAYAAVSELTEVIAHMRAARHKDRSWIQMSAHVGQGKHICGPKSCHYPGLDLTAQSTQYDWSALGRNLDESVVSRDFWL
jgi:hypothetical protein